MTITDEKEYVKLDYIAKKVGKRNNYVSLWIHLRPSLKIKKINKWEKNYPVCLFEKSEADRVIEMIKHKEQYPADSTLKEKRDIDDFSDPEWFNV